MKIVFQRKEGKLMYITLADLIQLLIMLIAFAALIIKLCKERKK